MALKVQSSFASGEIDPVLHERTTLAKFQNGLKTGRNVVVGKTGSALTRPSRKNVVETKLADREVLLYSPPSSGYLLEWGHEYVRIYDSGNSLLFDTAHALTEDDLPEIHFENTGVYVYIWRYGTATLRLNYTTGAFTTLASTVLMPPAPTNGTVTPVGAPTGYALDYAVTYVKNGEESNYVTIAAGSLPIAAGQSNTIDVRVATTAALRLGISEVRVYRRPQNGGAFGLIGSTTYIYVPSGTLYHGSFTDLGQAADYSQSPPTMLVVGDAPAVIPAYAPSYAGKTGVMYQQRLLQGAYLDKEAILASRPGFITNYGRDFPLNSDSALRFKAGASGFAELLRMIEHDGLVVFTKQGVWLHTGALTPENVTLTKKGKWIIKEDIPPMSVPGGLFFVDSATETIRNLVWSQDLNGFNGQEVSLFSDHLFREREIVSWAYHEGKLPLLWAVFSDGTFASFTYEFDHEMRAWTRHDSVPDILVEQVCSTGIPDKTFFLVNKDGTRYIEETIPRFVPAATAASDSEYDKGVAVAFMDSMKSFNGYLNDDLTPGDNFTLTPVTPEDWEGELTLDCDTSAIFTIDGPVLIGAILRVFDEAGCEFDLEVIARASSNSITVQPNIEFPEYMASDLRLYLTANEFTGLDHLEGELVSVIQDGYVISSPNNDINNYEDIIVSSGRITLPGDLRGAIVHVGRPITADVETLDIATVEQAPTVVESMTVNKLSIKVHQSRNVYVGPMFPPDDKVASSGEGIPKMEVIGDEIPVDYNQEEPIISNRYPRPQTVRHELTLPGDWKSNGRICMRSVDPLHFQLLSVIPDVTIERRSDR